MNEHQTSEGLIPMKMCSSVITLDQYAEGWMLADSDSASEARIFEQRIAFDLPFSYVPLVHVGIARLRYRQPGCGAYQRPCGRDYD